MSNDASWVWNWEYSHPVGYPHYVGSRWAERVIFSKENLQKIPPKMRRRKWIPTSPMFASELNAEGKRTFYNVPVSEYDQMDKQTLNFMQRKDGIGRTRQEQQKPLY